MTLNVDALDHIVLNVSDVVRSADWYANILGMTIQTFDPGGGKPPRTMLTFGRNKINLRPIGTSKVDWFTANHESAGSEDLCFLTTSSPDEVVAHLQSHNIAIEEGPCERHGARGTLRSVYCRDPDGSLIEISSYAETK